MVLDEKKIVKPNLRVLISTGHLGTAPSAPESFHRGMDTDPDFVVADGGSSDPGPVYLGEDITLGHFVREELELFLTASRRKKTFRSSSARPGTRAATEASMNSFRRSRRSPASTGSRDSGLDTSIPKFQDNS
jgi:hypothetical protein